MFVAMALGFTWAVVIAAALYVAALALVPHAGFDTRLRGALKCRSPRPS